MFRSSFFKPELLFEKRLEKCKVVYSGNGTVENWLPVSRGLSSAELSFVTTIVVPGRKSEMLTRDLHGSRVVCVCDV